VHWCRKPPHVVHRYLLKAEDLTYRTKATLDEHMEYISERYAWISGDDRWISSHGYLARVHTVPRDSHVTPNKVNITLKLDDRSGDWTTKITEQSLDSFRHTLMLEMRDGVKTGCFHTCVDDWRSGIEPHSAPFRQWIGITKFRITVQPEPCVRGSVPRPLFGLLSASELYRDVYDASSAVLLPLPIYIEEDAMLLSFPLWVHEDEEEVPDAHFTDTFRVFTIEDGINNLKDENNSKGRMLI
jgi:hypothetical protein